MASYAVINGGVIVDNREIADINAYPEHKRTARDERGDGGPVLRPIEDTAPPSYNKRTQTRTGPTWDIQPDRVVKTWTVDYKPLDAIKATLTKVILETAEEIRLSYITPGDGKSMSYREGYEEAVEVLADPGAALALANNPSSDPAFDNAAEEAYPVLYPDIGKGGTTDIVGIATLVAQMFEAFQKVENGIKKATNPGLAAVDAATTPQEAEAAFNAIQWPQ